MDGFLVVLRCSMDDISLSLHATKAEAETAASEVTGNEEVECWGRNIGSPGCVCIVEFNDGKPVALDIAKKF